MSLDKDIQDVIKELRKLENQFSVNERGKILKKGGRILAQAVKQKLEQKLEQKGIKSKNPHHRYKDGEKVEKFFPGNLKRSIKVMKGKAVDSVFVGPKIKGSRSKVVDRDSEGSVNGYYAHFVEHGTAGSKVYEDRTFVNEDGKLVKVKKGTHIRGQKPNPFMRPAWDENKGKLNEFFKNEFTNALKEYEQKVKNSSI